MTLRHSHLDPTVREAIDGSGFRNAFCVFLQLISESPKRKGKKKGTTESKKKRNQDAALLPTRGWRRRVSSTNPLFYFDLSVTSRRRSVVAALNLTSLPLIRCILDAYYIYSGVSRSFSRSCDFGSPNCEMFFLCLTPILLFWREANLIFAHDSSSCV